MAVGRCRIPGQIGFDMGAAERRDVEAHFPAATQRDIGTGITLRHP